MFREHGPAADVLSVEELPELEPGPGEVRVRVERSGVNPTDWKQRRGNAGRQPLTRFPFVVPNQDGAGVIVAVGPGVPEERIGERVWLYFCAWQRQFGSAAEFVTIPSRQAVALPAQASYELGASLGIPALTAHRCLTLAGPCEGKTVLVAGGAGAVGHFAVELARDCGARVVATASGPEKAALATRAGAELVVNYRDPDAAEQVRAFAPEGVDLVVEVALGTNLGLDLAVLAPNGHVATYATDAVDPTLAVGQLMARNLGLHFVLVYTMPTAALEAAVSSVSDALARSVLTELPSHHFPLEEIAAAHDAVEGGAVGKVFVDL